MTATHEPTASGGEGDESGAQSVGGQSTEASTAQAAQTPAAELRSGDASSAGASSAGASSAGASSGSLGSGGANSGGASSGSLGSGGASSGGPRIRRPRNEGLTRGGPRLSRPRVGGPERRGSPAPAPAGPASGRAGRAVGQARPPGPAQSPGKPHPQAVRPAAGGTVHRVHSVDGHRHLGTPDCFQHEPLGADGWADRPGPGGHQRGLHQDHRRDLQRGRPGAEDLASTERAASAGPQGALSDHRARRADRQRDEGLPEQRSQQGAQHGAVPDRSG